MPCINENDDVCGRILGRQIKVDGVAFIRLLKERNVRQGLFEAGELQALLRYLPLMRKSFNTSGGKVQESNLPRTALTAPNLDLKSSAPTRRPTFPYDNALLPPVKRLRYCRRNAASCQVPHAGSPWVVEEHRTLSLR